MFCLPYIILLYCIGKGLSDDEAIDIIHGVGSLTHGHIRANIGCGLIYFMAASILKGTSTLTARLQEGLDKGFAFYENHLDDHENLGYNMVKDGNYMYKKSLYLAIEGQAKARDMLSRNIPEDEWIDEPI